MRATKLPPTPSVEWFKGLVLFGRTEMRMADEKHPSRFATDAVHSGTHHIGDAVNTPIFQSSTYKLTDERYAVNTIPTAVTIAYFKAALMRKKGIPLFRRLHLKHRD